MSKKICNNFESTRNGTKLIKMLNYQGWETTSSGNSQTQWCDGRFLYYCQPRASCFKHSSDWKSCQRIKRYRNLPLRYFWFWKRFDFAKTLKWKVLPTYCRCADVRFFHNVTYQNVLDQIKVYNSYITYFEAARPRCTQGHRKGGKGEEKTKGFWFLVMFNKPGLTKLLRYFLNHGSNSWIEWID